jgi:hypothetical protein
VHEPASEPISYVIGDEDSSLIAPPASGSDVCFVCRGIIYGGGSECENCEQNAAALDGFLQPVISVSLYARPGRLRDWLTFYKDGDGTPAHPAAEDAVSQIFVRFFSANAGWLDRLDVDFAVVVPSTLRPPPHPMASLLSVRVPGHLNFRAPLTRTSAPLGHNHPNPRAFEVIDDVQGARILLLDDVYTSGARAQSAAYALRVRGAEIAALCVLGRRYNPAYSARAASLLAEQRNSQYQWQVDLRD